MILNNKVAVVTGASSSVGREIALLFAKEGAKVVAVANMGEIFADLHKNEIIVMPYGGEKQVIDVSKLSDDFSGHAGGDNRMVEEFLDMVSGRSEATIRTTTLRNSMESHFMALAAERSRLENGRCVSIAEVTGEE